MARVEIPSDGEQPAHQVSSGMSPSTAERLANALRKKVATSTRFIPKPVPRFDAANFPERDWAIPDLVCRRNVTLLPGPSSGGKSSLTYNVVLASVTGRGDI